VMPRARAVGPDAVQAWMLGLGVLLAASAAAQLRPVLPGFPRELVAPSGFLMLLTAIAACLGVRLWELRWDWVQLMALGTVCAGLFVMSRAGLIGSPDTPFELLGIIAYAAWIEELVFRRVLPRAFMRGLASSRGPRPGVVAVVASQFLFAATHFLPGLQQQAGIGWAALMRLFVGGLLLAAVVSRSGLAIGALLHAELNLRAVLPQPPPGAPSTTGLCLVAMLAIGITLNLPPMHLTSTHPGAPHEKSICPCRRRGRPPDDRV
jgi:hypothetical protein